MGRESFLRDAAAGKVKAEKVRLRDAPRAIRIAGAKGVSNAHTGRGIVRYAPRAKGKTSPLLKSLSLKGVET